MPRASASKRDGNVTRQTFLEHHDIIVEKLRLKKEADSALGDAYKAAERDGIDKKELKRAIADGNLSSENNKAFEAGVTAGKAGADLASCPFDPGSEEYQSFSLGWSQGQKAAVEALGGTTRTAANQH